MKRGSQKHRSGIRSIPVPYWLIPVIAVGAVAFLGVAIGILMSSRMLGVKMPPLRRPTQPTWEQTVALEMKADHKVGAVIKLPAIEDLQRHQVQLPLRGVSALMYVSRYEISEGDVRAMEREMAAYPRVKTCVVFMLSDPAMVQQRAQQAGLRSELLYDRGGQLYRTLNAFGNSRLYVFGWGGKLAFIENPLDSEKETIRKARGAIERALRGT
jgi:hypothetical protein